MGSNAPRTDAVADRAPDRRNDLHPGLLNVYDVEGRLIATRPRGPARAAARQARTARILLVDGEARVLLRRRPKGGDLGGAWDTTVSGEIDAGHAFDTAAVRMAGAVLFGDPDDPHVALAERAMVFRAREAELAGRVMFHAAGMQLDTREERGGDGESILVACEVALYLGRIGVPRKVHPSRVACDLHHFAAIEVDRLLTDGLLTPGMASCWLARGFELLAIAGGVRPAKREAG